MSQNRTTNHDLKKDRIMASVFDQTAVGICITDQTGRFVQVNQAYCHIYGYTRSELIGQPFTLVVPEDARHDAQLLHDRFIEGEPEIPIEWVVQRKDGCSIIVVVTAALMKDDDGKKYKITTVTDVTHQKKAEQLINRFGRILAQSYDEIFIFDSDTLKFIQANESALKNLGYTLEEIRQLTPMDIDLDAEGQKLDESLRSLRAREKDFCIFETIQKRKDGTTYQVEVRLQFMHHEHPSVFVAIVQDISERKKLDRIRQELNAAAAIQNGLMPQTKPDIPGYCISGSSFPSKLVGGDYFDFQVTRDGNLAFCLGDVAGKGMPAALLMCNLQAIIRGQTMSHASPSECLKATNRIVYYNTPTDRFVSLFYGILDPKAHTILSANAGHDLPITIKRGAQTHHLPAGNIVLGVKKDVSYAQHLLHLDASDILVAFSDGIIEAMNDNGEFYGEDRLVATVLEHRDKSSDEIASALVTSVDEFLHGQPPQDDLTVLVIKRNSNA